MPIPQLPGSLNTVDDIKNYIIRLERELRFLMESGLDSTNAFEFGGWRVKPDQIISKDADVGMSTADTAADDVRFFAGPNGDVWFYYVTKSGKLYATDAYITGLITGSTIIGGVIKTAETGARIEIKNNSLLTYNSSNQLQGFAWGTDTSSSTYGDAFFYKSGTRIAEFFNTVTDGLAFYPSSGFSLFLGISGRQTYARGNWSFSNFVDLGPNTATGKVQYAGYADASASSSSADSVDWANVTNHPDPTATPLVDGTASIGTGGKYAYDNHRHPTDTSRAPTASPTFTGTVVLPSTTSIGSVSNAEIGYLDGVTSAIQTQLNTKPTNVIKQGAGLSGTESLGSGFYYATLTINYTGFTVAPKIHAYNTDTHTAWITAVTPISTTSATIYISSTVSGVVASRNISWTAIGT